MKPDTIITSIFKYFILIFSIILFTYSWGMENGLEYKVVFYASLIFFGIGVIINLLQLILNKLYE